LRFGYKTKGRKKASLCRRRSRKIEKGRGEGGGKGQVLSLADKEKKKKKKKGPQEGEKGGKRKPFLRGQKTRKRGSLPLVSKGGKKNGDGGKRSKRLFLHSGAEKIS